MNAHTPLMPGQTRVCVHILLLYTAAPVAAAASVQLVGRKKKHRVFTSFDALSNVINKLRLRALAHSRRSFRTRQRRNAAGNQRQKRLEKKNNFLDYK